MVDSAESMARSIRFMLSHLRRARLYEPRRSQALGKCTKDAERATLERLISNVAIDGPGSSTRQVASSSPMAVDLDASGSDDSWPEVCVAEPASPDSWPEVDDSAAVAPSPKRRVLAGHVSVASSRASPKKAQSPTKA